MRARSATIPRHSAVIYAANRFENVGFEQPLAVSRNNRRIGAVNIRLADSI
jgi:hypothetical protein